MRTGRRRMGLKLALPLAAAVAILGSGCGPDQVYSTPTHTPTRTQAFTADLGSLSCDGVQVKWFVGLGPGTNPAQVDAEINAVKAINKRNQHACGPLIKLEIVPHAEAYDVLKTEIAAGNAPDVVGPIGTGDRNGFEGLFRDLTPLIAEAHYDLTQFNPTLVRYLSLGGEGQIGVPYTFSPGYIWFNKDIFNRAGLAPLPVKVGDTYSGEPWTWETLGKLAAELTVDNKGRKSTDEGFDPAHIVQYGMDFPGSDARHVASFFGGGSFVATDGKTAQIPEVWTAAFNWYYDAIWKGHFVPNAAAESSALLAHGNSQASGNVAMTASSLSTLGSIGSDARESKVKSWDIGIVPSNGGVTTTPLEVETFVVTEAGRHPDEAFQIMATIMADPDLVRAYGGVPAAGDRQAAYFESLDAQLAPIFPGNLVTWPVIGEMAKVPASPSQESDMPNVKQSEADIDKFFGRLGSTPNLDLGTELLNLQKTLQSDWDCACPLLNE